ncbi:hypothetical protein QV09_07360 [Gallibacterium salpingitidis]|uniref:YubB ferredoxin-like domain-containing protein n=1 Tax=Gallibacterium salpingitidis TaxID=505341 RepID=A0AB36E1Q3_9PAST|nr:hypothetical protein [Gallibacterium salpingitidis]OBX09694.1 hypothetical protein QV09_07360 [Gallibacterium salpingitidis]WKS98788.1 hypothetical protein NYR30_08410 [Gallibacterium salpingitidis]
MPNWCKNTLEITTNTLAEFRQVFEKVMKFATEKQQFCLDFNLLLPMPEALMLEDNTSGENGFKLLSVEQELLVTDTLWEELRIFANEDTKTHLLDMASKYQWRVTDLIHYLDQYPEEQQHCHIDLGLARKYMANVAKYGAKTWYDWRYQHWGVKWNAEQFYLSDIDETTKSFTVSFETAWNPPTNWFYTLIDTFPNIYCKLTYSEYEIGFTGVMSSKPEEEEYYEFDPWGEELIAEDTVH